MPVSPTSSQDPCLLLKLEELEEFLLCELCVLAFTTLEIKIEKLKIDLFKMKMITPLYINRNNIFITNKYNLNS